jgi:hypothetical protein
VILKKKHISLFPNFPWYKHGEIAHGSPRLTSLLDKGAPPFYWQSEQYADKCKEDGQRILEPS